MIKLLLILFVTSFNINAIAFERTIEGEVISVTDGDTVKVKGHRNRIDKILLAQIDTPEKKQPWGQKAKQALSDKIFGKRVKIDIETTDRYGRLVGTIWYAGNDINREMVREGHAWVYRKYAKDKSLFDDESYARSRGLGLWSLPENQRQALWKWRKVKQNK